MNCSVNVLFFMHPYRQIRSIRLLIRLRLMDWNFLRSGVICFRCFVIEELMVLTGEEKEYLDMFEKGEYMPSLLFSDNQILENIVEHPIAIWKVQSTQKIEIKL